MNGNWIRTFVTWRGKPGVTLAGKAITLRFGMRDTKLYSFQFVPKEKAARQ